MKSKGFYWHCHHDELCEYVYNYQERVDYIKKEKPKNEVKTRLRLFKKIKGKLPEKFVEAWEKYDKAWEKYYEVREKYNEVREKYYEAWEKYYEAWEKYDKAWEKYYEVREKYNEVREKYDKAWEKYDKAWEKYKPQIEELHKKECGCKEWNGKKLVFKEVNKK